MRFDPRKMDRRLALSVGLSLVSLVLLSIGLIAVVSAVTDDPVQLPNEGSIDEIVEESSGGSTSAGGQVAEIPPLPSGPAPVRLGVPTLYIDAPVITMGFIPDSNNIPDVPSRPDQVAWYDFTAAPALNNNAVFAGHVDWQTPRGDPIPGAFYRLRELRIGDPITVTLEDGQVIEYAVTGNVATEYDDPNVVKSMGLTSRDVITLITCGGSWVHDPSKATGGNYSHRVIVRAERIDPVEAVAR